MNGQGPYWIDIFRIRRYDLTARREVTVAEFPAIPHETVEERRARIEAVCDFFNAEEDPNGTPE